jgi:hypothetical protein
MAHPSSCTQLRTFLSIVAPGLESPTRAQAAELYELAKMIGRGAIRIVALRNPATATLFILGRAVMNFRRLSVNFAKVNFMRRFDNPATHGNFASLSGPFSFSSFFEKLSRSGVFCFKIWRGWL